MSETKKPLLAEALGKEVGEVFVFTGGTFGPYCISQDGRLAAAAEALDASSAALLEIINLWVQWVQQKQGEGSHK